MKYTFFIFLALLASMGVISSVKAQTDLGIMYSEEELAIWRQRSNGATAVDYKTTGADGTPGDFDRIKGYADAFLANPSASLWKGTTVPGDNYPIYEGINLQQAAFCYQIYKKSNPTLANRYAAAARTALLQQIAMPNTDVSKWVLATVFQTGVNESRWITRLVFATDYLSSYLSAADKTTLNTWFLNQANFMAAHIQNREVGQCFPRRLQNDYTVVGRDAKPAGELYGKFKPGNTYGDGFIYSHVNANGSLGNRISFLSTWWNNRNADKVTMIGMVGLYLNNNNLIFQAKQYAKEWLKYSVYPDGTMGEYERNGNYNLPQQGMSYSAINIWQYILLAEGTARRGDTELYTYTTSVGMHGTEGGTKSLRLVVEKYCKNVQGNPAIYFDNVTANNRIDSYGEAANIELMWDALFAVPNKYWQSTYITSIYTRTAPGLRPYPKAPVGVASAAMVWFPWGGSGAEMPGVLLMAGQLERDLRVYNATSVVDVPTNLRVPFVLQTSTQFIWDHAVGTVAYNVRYRPINTATWVTLSNLLNTYTGTIPLEPALVYEWQVQGVGATISSAWSELSFTTTPTACTGNSTIARELRPNQTGYFLWQTSSLPLSTAPASTRNLTTLEATGTGTSNYFTRTRGFVCTPASGTYTFWLSGDDEAELYLSTNDNSANAVRIASTKWTNAREFTKYPTQRSAAITLMANKRYYIEVRQLQVGGLDHFCVQWQMPSGAIETPIAGSRISPFSPNSAPTTGLTADKASYTNGESIVLTGTPADADGVVTRLDFYLDNTKIGTDFLPPWEYTYANVPAGTYNFRAIAVDNTNASSVAATLTRVVSANQAPAATLVSDKTSYAPGNNIVLTATATDADGTVAKVDFYNGTTLLGTDAATPYTFTFSAAASGSYTFRAIATDNQGTASAPVSLARTVSANTAPTIGLTSDKPSYTAGNDIILTASAADTDGTVAKVEFYIGTTRLATDITAPYTYTLAGAGAGSQSYNAVVTDNMGAATTSATVTVTVTGTTGTGMASACATGTITREMWTGITGTALSTVPVQNPTITTILSAGLETPTGFAENYAQRVRGYVCPPVTGAYTFWVAGDDAAELWLSTTEDTANKVRICRTSVFTNVREYTKSPSQRSVAITLQAGYRYYIEAVQKEGTGGDNLSVAWQIPGGAFEAPIPATRLSPWAGIISYGCKSSANITRETWNNITGDITAMNWASNPWWRGLNGSTEPPRNINDNFAQRLYGYLCPPLSGMYTLQIAGDDQTELWLSPDETPANMQRIAHNYTPTLLREFTRLNSQTATVWLSAGRRYYIEARHRDLAGDDFMTVAWTLPNGTQETPIPASRLASFVSRAARLGLEDGFLPQGKAEAVRVSLYPNPATSALTLVTNTFAGEEWKIRVVSQVGAEVKTYTRSFSLDQFQTQIPVDDLAPGLYVLHIIDGLGQAHSLRFSKQN